MTNADLHDVFLAGTAVLPVVYLPLVLVWLESSRKQAANTATAALLLVGTIVFGNAEVCAFAGMLRYPDTPEAAALHPLSVTYLILLFGSLLLGMAIALAPLGDAVFGRDPQPGRAVARFVGLFVAAVCAVVPPMLVLSASFGIGNSSMVCVLAVGSVAASVFLVTRDAVRRWLRRRAEQASTSQTDVDVRGQTDAEPENSVTQGPGMDEIRALISSTDRLVAALEAREAAAARWRKLLTLR